MALHSNQEKQLVDELMNQFQEDKISLEELAESLSNLNNRQYSNQLEILERIKNIEEQLVSILHDKRTNP